MKKILTTMFSVFLTTSLISGIALAQNQDGEGPKWVPVETWTCDYNDGKGPADLDAVIDDFNDFLDDKGVTTYFAATVTPQYFGERLFDVGWLGAWKDGNAFGSSTDMWKAEGGEMATKIFDVLNCSSHTNFASTNIKPPKDDDDENDNTFVLVFTNCSVAEGRNFDEVMAGINAWAEHQTANGFQNSTYMMFPIFGESDDDYDFKLVHGHDDYSAFGAVYELMGNGGHWMKEVEIFEGLIDCDIARVYDARMVREMQDGDDG